MDKSKSPKASSKAPLTSLYVLTSSCRDNFDLPAAAPSLRSREATVATCGPNAAKTVVPAATPATNGALAAVNSKAPFVALASAAAVCVIGLCSF